MSEVDRGAHHRRVSRGAQTANHVSSREDASPTLVGACTTHDQRFRRSVGQEVVKERFGGTETLVVAVLTYVTRGDHASSSHLAVTGAGSVGEWRGEWRGEWSVKAENAKSRRSRVAQAPLRVGGWGGGGQRWWPRL